MWKGSSLSCRSSASSGLEIVKDRCSSGLSSASCHFSPIFLFSCKTCWFQAQHNRQRQQTHVDCLTLSLHCLRSNVYNESLMPSMGVLLLWPYPNGFSLPGVAWVRESQARYHLGNYIPYWFPRHSNRYLEKWILGQGRWAVSWCFLMTRVLPNPGKNKGICPRYSIAFLSGHLFAFTASKEDSYVLVTYEW